jgi:Domain of unknown function (DUF4384)
MKTLIIAACVLALCFVPPATATQDARDEETTRKLWDTAFGSPRRKRAPAARAAARRNYRQATPRVSPANVSDEAVIGVTIWRLRQAKASDEGERMFVHEGSGSVGWVPERVAAGAGLSEGDRVRLSIEAARSGYLYVIDREQYADGTLGEPYLIFPTTRTLRGDNQVKAGRLVDIPAQEDAPPYFTLRRSRADQVGELLTVIVTKEPLEEVRPGAQAQRLSAERVAMWERTWGSQVGRLELSGGVGRAWTKEEKEAGASAERLLKAAAPAPQTLYYSPRVTPDEPLLIKVQLQYRRRVSPPNNSRRK